MQDPDVIDKMKYRQENLITPKLRVKKKKKRAGALRASATASGLGLGDQQESSPDQNPFTERTSPSPAS
jgi:hypothetical protein